MVQRHGIVLAASLGLVLVGAATFAAAPPVTNEPGHQLLAPAQQIAPGAASMQVTTLLNCGCADHAIRLAGTYASIPSGAVEHTVVTVNGVVYMDQVGSFLSGWGTFTWGLFANNSGGTATGTWPLPSGYPVYVNITVEDPLGTVLGSTHLVLDGCDSCNIVSNEHSPGTPVPATGHLGLIVLAALLLIAGVFVILRLRA